jgi:hypothetical protein
MTVRRGAGAVASPSARRRIDVFKARGCCGKGEKPMEHARRALASLIRESADRGATDSQAAGHASNSGQAEPNREPCLRTLVSRGWAEP